MVYHLELRRLLMNDCEGDRMFAFDFLKEIVKRKSRDVADHLMMRC
jgi:hypothetical protein